MGIAVSAVTFAVVLIFILAIIRFGNSRDQPTPRPAAAPTPEVPTTVEEKPPHDLAMENTRIVKQSWYKDAFGTIMKASFTIRNDGNVPVKDLEILCVHAAPSGTMIDSNTRTIYELFPPHSTKHINDFDMGFIHSQADRSRCAIKDLTVMDGEGQ